MRSRKFNFKIDIYGASFNLIVADNLEKARISLFKKRDWEYDSSVDQKGTYEALFLFDDPDTKEYIIILHPKASPGTIAHEVSHLVSKLLVTCGVDIINNDEPFTYLVGHLVDLVWDKIKTIK